MLPHGLRLRALAGSAWIAAALLIAPGAHAQPAAATTGAAASAAAKPPAKVLRYAFPRAETGFDPAQISDLYSRVLAANIFESPLTYDFLARPAKLKPQTLEAMPEVSQEHRRFVFRVKPGIRFADDPAFQGRPRELVAADYVYSFKRLYDPRLKSPNLFQLQNAGLLGLSELRERAIRDKTPFPYDTEVEGLRTLDRYTFEIRLAAPSPRFLYVMADAAVTGAVAREVIEAYPGQSMEHPVGTGPFRLAQWKRSSRIVLERNPGYREVHYEAEPPADDPVSQAILQTMKGRRLPIIDRVEVAIVEENQPRWLGFLNREHDMLERLPEEYAPLAIPNNRLAPNLAKQGVVLEQTSLGDVGFTYFGMEHPVVGGYTPEKVALRRALGLAYNVREEIALVREGQMIPAQQMLSPSVSGYDPKLRSEMSDFDRAASRALLDLYGYVDADGDGWRDLPDGSPLVLEYATQTDQQSRKLTELWKKNMDAIGVQLVARPAQWPENLKASRAGKLMMWGVAWSAATPDGSYFMDLLYGPSKGQANHARFALPAYDALFERQRELPDGPERQALITQTQKLAVAYMPYKASGHRIATDLMHPWVSGYRRHPFMRDWWRYVDVDAAAQAAAR